MMIKIKHLILEGQRYVELSSKTKKLELDLRKEFPQLRSLNTHVKPDDSLYVDDIVVKPLEQGKGIGTRVMKKLIEFAQQEGINIILQAIPTPGQKERLQKFYKNLGFVKNVGDTLDPEIKPVYHRTMYIKPKK